MVQVRRTSALLLDTHIPVSNRLHSTPGVAPSPPPAPFPPRNPPRPPSPPASNCTFSFTWESVDLASRSYASVNDSLAQLLTYGGAGPPEGWFWILSGTVYTQLGAPDPTTLPTSACNAAIQIATDRLAPLGYVFGASDVSCVTMGAPPPPPPPPPPLAELPPLPPPPAADSYPVCASTAGAACLSLLGACSGVEAGFRSQGRRAGGRGWAAQPCRTPVYPVLVSRSLRPRVWTCSPPRAAQVCPSLPAASRTVALTVGTLRLLPALNTSSPEPLLPLHLAAAAAATAPMWSRFGFCESGSGRHCTAVCCTVQYHASYVPYGDPVRHQQATPPPHRRALDAAPAPAGHLQAW